MKLFFILVAVIFSFSILSAKNPKVFIEHETGERFIPEDSDYIDIDFKDNVSYKFDIYKVGVKQFFKNNKSYSIIYKIIDKDYHQSLDNTGDDDNNSNTLTAYYKFKPYDHLSLKFQTTYRKRNYEEFQSAKESTWIANSLLFQLKPDFKNKFFTDKTNEYTLSMRYKTTDYKFAPEKESKDFSYYISWKKDLYKNLVFKFRFKSSTINYDVENNIRIDGSKKSYLSRLEYQF